jgi:hypothetical protein
MEAKITAGRANRYFMLGGVSVSSDIFFRGKKDY